MPPAPAKPAQMPTALARSSGGNTLVMVDRVPGMRSAAPRPVSARSPMSGPAELDERRQERSDAEDGGTGDQRAAAAEPVADRAGGEQQRGEHQGVRVDDPLLRRLAGVEAGGDARHRVGEHRHAGDDHHQGRAHHRQDPAPVCVLG